MIPSSSTITDASLNFSHSKLLRSPNISNSLLTVEIICVDFDIIRQNFYTAFNLEISSIMFILND